MGQTARGMRLAKSTAFRSQTSYNRVSTIWRNLGAVWLKPVLLKIEVQMDLNWMDWVFIALCALFGASAVFYAILLNRL